MASIASVVTMGYGSFGSVNLLPTLGYGSVTGVMLGQWSNVLSLQSFQPRIDLEGNASVDITSMQTRLDVSGADWLVYDSGQAMHEVDLP